MQLNKKLIHPPQDKMKEKAMKNLTMLRGQITSKLMLALVGICASLATVSANAQQVASAPTLGGIMKNIAGSISDGGKLIDTCAYVFGGALVFWGLLKLKSWSDDARSHPASKGLWCMFFGGLMLAYPTIQDSVMATTFGNSTIIKAKAYTPGS